MSSSTQLFPVDVSLPYVSINNEDKGPLTFDLKKELPDKKIVLTSAVGAFTPPCTEDHLPTYLDKIKEFKSKGVDKIIVLTINDPFVNNAWGKALGYKDSDDYVIFAQDPELKLSHELGDKFVADMSGDGLGTRSNRYAAIIEDGHVKYLEAEDGGAFTEKSNAETILKKL